LIWLAHLAAALSGMTTMRWRWTTGTKKYDHDWWLFMIFQATNVVVQLLAMWIK
jgi:hypothetical protein